MVALPDFPSTAYFRDRVLAKRSYLTPAVVMSVLTKPDHQQVQPDGRIRLWKRIPELDGRQFGWFFSKMAERFTTHSWTAMHRYSSLTMRLTYDKATDSLYIDLADRPAVDSREVTDGVVADFDVDGVLVGLDIEHASTRLDLTRVETDQLPMRSISTA